MTPVFTIALTATPPPDNFPVDHSQVAADVDALYKAGQGTAGTDQVRSLELYFPSLIPLDCLLPNISESVETASHCTVCTIINHQSCLLFNHPSSHSHSTEAYAQKYKSLTKIIKSEL